MVCEFRGKKIKSWDITINQACQFPFYHVTIPYIHLLRPERYKLAKRLRRPSTRPPAVAVAHHPRVHRN
jgi:hypothetical protein